MLIFEMKEKLDYYFLPIGWSPAYIMRTCEVKFLLMTDNKIIQVSQVRKKKRKMKQKYQL